MPEVRIPDAAGLADETVRRVEAGGRAIALVRTGGVLHALDDLCPHAGGPLGEGLLERGVLRCPWHERHFDPKTGACVDHPATRSVACYAVREDGADVLLRL